MQARQGDVLIIPIDKIPAGMRTDTPAKVVLAYGEVTGHHHRFECGKVQAFYKEGDDITISGGGNLRGTATAVEFISVPKTGASLVHEEHDTVNLTPGSYRIVRQREYDSIEGVRSVTD